MKLNDNSPSVKKCPFKTPITLSAKKLYRMISLQAQATNNVMKLSSMLTSPTCSEL